MATTPRPSARTTTAPVDAAIAGLKRRATKAALTGMARYGIPSDRVLGVAMRDIQAVAKTFGRNHALALALWDTGWYEARLLAAYVDDPAAVTRAQMTRWCRAFDNWAVCDTLCFVLFDRTPHAWPMVKAWAPRREEYVRRAAFALLWGLTVHDTQAGDAPFLEALRLVEDAAGDERHYVKKAVNMALRAVGRRSPALHAAAMALAARLAASDAPSARWIGADPLRDLRTKAPRPARSAPRG